MKAAPIGAARERPVGVPGDSGRAAMKVAPIGAASRGVGGGYVAADGAAMKAAPIGAARSKALTTGTLNEVEPQ